MKDKVKAAVPVRRRHVPETRSVESKVVNNLDKTESVTTREDTSSVSGESIVNPAHVSVMGKVTKNLGDYNSAQVSVGITLPCEATEEALEETYKRASAWVSAKIETELENV